MHAAHGRLTAVYNRDPGKAEAALAKGTFIRDLLLSIFAGFAKMAVRYHLSGYVN
jgi:hypothetical protein